jgi:DNA (cytosine-5)-methyltransferase 1
VIKGIDFFCGAGGLTRGLLDAGIAVLAGVDTDARLKATYEDNNKPSKFLAQDIRDINIKQLRKQLGIRSGDGVLYAACTPCQPFSTLNQMRGKDDRKSLLLSFARLVKQAPPDFILVENVPGLNTAYGREIYEQFADIMTRYRFLDPAAAMLDAADFGIPQVRKRFILLAARHQAVSLPVPSTAERATVGQFLPRYPPISDGESSDQYHNHVARLLPAHHKRILQAVPPNGGSRSDVADVSILLPCHQSRPNVHKDVFGRMWWDKPAPTLTCRCTDVYCGRFAHPEQDRGLSLREAAALQTFRDDYVFKGTFFHIAKQIGNAVPVDFARQLGESLTAT